MKCPYCDYKDGWDSKNLKVVEGDSGELFTLSNDIKAERTYESGYLRRETVYFCPECGKPFIDV